MNDYYKVKIKFSPFSQDAADLMAGFLSDIGFESFETDNDILIAYIQAESFNKNMLRQSIDEFPMECRLSWEVEFVEGQDWNLEWEKNYFKPIVLGDRCVVHATFHKDFPICEYEILIDPRMAFGTGHHATTSMMVSHLLDMDLSGKDVLDMGTGTGILAILAKMRDAAHVNAIEIDPMAYENARDNAKLNGVEVNFICGDARCLENCAPADVFLANINRNIILADLPSYVKRIKPSGLLVLSGFYVKDIPLLERALANFGMEIAKMSVKDDWCSLIVKFNK